MSFTFIKRTLNAGLYEPEGIYLTSPVEGEGVLLLGWGDHPDFYGRAYYNGIALSGYPGLALHLPTGPSVFAADAGRVTEISIEPNGLGRYIKMQHRWGESLYALLGSISVEAGQNVASGHFLAQARPASSPLIPQLHFGIRVAPYNRYDGWGGFTDPLPFLPPDVIINVDIDDDAAGGEEVTPIALDVPSSVRRP